MAGVGVLTCLDKLVVDMSKELESVDDTEEDESSGETGGV
jgi:hypothetical protein